MADKPRVKETTGPPTDEVMHDAATVGDNVKTSQEEFMSKNDSRINDDDDDNKPITKQKENDVTITKKQMAETPATSLLLDDNEPSSSTGRILNRKRSAKRSYRNHCSSSSPDDESDQYNPSMYLRNRPNWLGRSINKMATISTTTNETDSDDDHQADNPDNDGTGDEIMANDNNADNDNTANNVTNSNAEHEPEPDRNNDNLNDMPPLVSTYDSDTTADRPNDNDDVDTIEDNDDDDDNDEDDNDDDANENYATSNDELMKQVNEVLDKPKPGYTWNTIHELLCRENGIRRPTLYGCGGFETRYYASRHVVERMKLSHCLRKHRGCVNCLNFDRTGTYLLSGSDDTRIVIWKWAANKMHYIYHSGHSGNIFQVKFIDASSNCMDIISASHDGQVRRAIVRPEGGHPAVSHNLFKHREAVHKLALSPDNRYEVMSVGEDGCIRQKDLRSGEGATCLHKVTGICGRKRHDGTERVQRVRLFSIAHHPFAPEIAVSGSDSNVRIYDKRNFKEALREMCPEKLKDMNMAQVTCAVYNHNGNEVLASYSDDHIYLFNNRDYQPGSYMHCYRGHYNHGTIKGVNFFGPKSEYVISGSDCSHIFFWDKDTEAIVNYMPGDTGGVVNCLEPHPGVPILATSGLDHNVKIWTPHSTTYPPDLSSLQSCLKSNMRRTWTEEGTMDDRQFYFLFRQLQRHSHFLGSNHRRRSVAAAMLGPHIVNGANNFGDDDDDDIHNPTYTLHGWPLSNSNSNSNSSSSPDSSSSSSSEISINPPLSSRFRATVRRGEGAVAADGDGGSSSDSDDNRDSPSAEYDDNPHMDRFHCATQ